MRVGAGLLRVAAVLLCCAAPWVQAARPMITDDARIVDPRACQLETWVRRNEGSSERWALPACNPGGNLELTVGGGLTREGGETHATDVQVQGKTIFRPLATHDWGVGLAIGNLRHPDLAPTRSRARDLYAYAPISLSLADDAVVLHGNVGTIRTRDEGHHRATAGLGAELRMYPRLYLIPEVFKADAGRAMFQAGVRFWLVPGRMQLDATYGNRLGGEKSPWISVGVRLLTPPFLP